MTEVDLLNEMSETRDDLDVIESNIDCIMAEIAQLSSWAMELNDKKVKLQLKVFDLKNKLEELENGGRK